MRKQQVKKILYPVSAGLPTVSNDLSEKLFGLYKRFRLHREEKALGMFMLKTQDEINKGTPFTIEFENTN